LTIRRHSGQLFASAFIAIVGVLLFGRPCLRAVADACERAARKASNGPIDPIRAAACRNSEPGSELIFCGNAGTGGRERRCSVVIDIDVVYVNMDDCTAYCSDGVTRPFYEMYDACAELTQDPDEAMVAIIKIADDKFIMLGLVGEEPALLH
jgi:hypothetical protein